MTSPATEILLRQVERAREAKRESVYYSFPRLVMCNEDVQHVTHEAAVDAVDRVNMLKGTKLKLSIEKQRLCYFIAAGKV